MHDYEASFSNCQAKMKAFDTFLCLYIYKYSIDFECIT